MRKLILTLWLLLSSICPSHAESAIKAIQLVGKWTVSDKHSSGAIVGMTIVFTQNMKFTAKGTLDGKPMMDLTGSWSLDGNLLSWKYESSSINFPAPGFIDQDDVLSAEPDKLVLYSHLSGKTRELARVR